MSNFPTTDTIVFRNYVFVTYRNHPNLQLRSNDLRILILSTNHIIAVLKILVLLETPAQLNNSSSTFFFFTFTPPY